MSLCPNCTVTNPAAHSSMPSGPWEIGVVAVGLVIVVLSLVVAVKLLLRPGERSPDHIKRTVLDDSGPRPREA